MSRRRPPPPARFPYAFRPPMPLGWGPQPNPPPWHMPPGNEADARQAVQGMVQAGIEQPYPHAGFRPGDPPSPGNERNRWAGTVFLANTGSAFRLAVPPVNGATGNGPLCSTPDLAIPRTLFIQLEFSEPDANGTPGRWSPLTIFDCRVTVSRGVDQQATAQVDTFDLSSDGATGGAIQWLPIESVQARQLDISIELTEPAGGSQAQWCRAVITAVDTPVFSPAGRGESNIFGAGRTLTSGRVEVDNAAPGTLVLPQMGWRTGFIIHVPNTTDEPDAVDVAFRFASPVSLPDYGFILRPGQTYEAFPEYWWGAVYAQGLGGESGTVPINVTSLVCIGSGG